mgnify:CR=1 FL=1
MTDQLIFFISLLQENISNTNVVTGIAKYIKPVPSNFAWGNSQRVIGFFSNVSQFTLPIRLA